MGKQELSCLISLLETLTEMLGNGIKILPKFVQMFQSVWSETKLMFKIEKSKPVKLSSIEKETFNTTISLLSQITNLKSLSSG